MADNSETYRVETDADLSEFYRFQQRWASVGFTASTVGICLMYALLRAVVDLWPAGLTMFIESAMIRTIVFFASMWGIAIHLLIDSAILRRWTALGEITNSVEFPSNLGYYRRYLWVLVVIVVNEMSGLVIYVAER